uniref:Cytochrome bo(3) ubiquinol oxidase subunit 3 n=1 Tax=Candidatus Aschnera chinzeii TaxID=1485666 RepID=A0AAT9G3R9_9ENTR|nr:MAG: cytochrome o ubiquinol oxidase subunit III [Candidatus Aschnera chinzeii]
MSINFINNNINHYHHDDNINQTKLFGFWIYLMSDLIIFACLFATYIVLTNNADSFPTGKEIFNIPYVLIETIFLLLSSITCCIAMCMLLKNNINLIILWLLITLLLGLIFIIMELFEFYQLISLGYTPSKNAFLSSYFTLVSIHGIHVIIGLLWIIIIIINIKINGINHLNETRLHCLSLFWHFLDIIWICVYSIVYLLGTII